MKKKVFALALCLSMLLPMGIVHAAGTAEDPLISESYIKGAFIHAVESVVKAMLEGIEDSYTEPLSPSTGMISKELSAGKIIKLSTGQSIILLSGSAEIVKDKGTIVNATMGLEAGSGILYKNHRYIVCEDSAATVKVLKDSNVYMSESAKIEDGKIEDTNTENSGESPKVEAPALSPAHPEVTPSPTPSESPTPAESPLPFLDVAPGDWYYDELLFCYEKGLINGLTPTIFGGGNRLTVAESYKLCACLHQLYHATSLFPGAGDPWYKGYVDYCRGFDIGDGDSGSYNAAITRRQFADMVYSALPQSSLSPINSIPDGAISNISESGEWVDKVYTLYRAGILTGYTADSIHSEHDFAPDDYISRAEMVSVICRILDKTQRIRFTIE